MIPSNNNDNIDIDNDNVDDVDDVDETPKLSIGKCLLDVSNF